MSVIHNHNPDQERGLDCGERLLPDGSRRGWCIPPQPGERVRLSDYIPIPSGVTIWGGYEARVTVLGNVVDHEFAMMFADRGLDMTILEPIEPRPDVGIGTFFWRTDRLTIIPVTEPDERALIDHLEEIAPLGEMLEREEAQKAQAEAEAKRYTDEPMNLAADEWRKEAKVAEREAFEAGWRAAIRTAVVLIASDADPAESDFEEGQLYGVHQAAETLKYIGGRP